MEEQAPEVLEVEEDEDVIEEDADRLLDDDEDEEDNEGSVRRLCALMSNTLFLGFDAHVKALEHARARRREALAFKSAVEEDVAVVDEGAAKKTQEGPEVDPTKFIAACQQLIADFGNIDDNGEPLMVRINAIAAIAETVATELYGDVTSAREQQDLMWNEATTSVFDLEAAELAAEQKGETMPWHNDAYDGKLPDGFTADQAGQYIKKVGGG